MLPSSTLHGLGTKSEGPSSQGTTISSDYAAWRVPSSLAVSYWITGKPQVIPTWTG